jgi:hypothetical protein
MSLEIYVHPEMANLCGIAELHARNIDKANSFLSVYNFILNHIIEGLVSGKKQIDIRSGDPIPDTPFTENDIVILHSDDPSGTIIDPMIVGRLVQAGQTVTLYGGVRDLCLRVASEKAIEVGAIVDVSIAGSYADLSPEARAYLNGKK